MRHRIGFGGSAVARTGPKVAICAVGGGASCRPMLVIMRVLRRPRQPRPRSFILQPQPQGLVGSAMQAPLDHGRIGQCRRLPGRQCRLGPRRLRGRKNDAPGQVGSLGALAPDRLTVRVRRDRQQGGGLRRASQTDSGADHFDAPSQQCTAYRKAIQLYVRVDIRARAAAGRSGLRHDRSSADFGVMRTFR